MVVVVVVVVVEVALIVAVMVMVGLLIMRAERTPGVDTMVFKM